MGNEVDGIQMECSDFMHMAHHTAIWTSAAFRPVFLWFSKYLTACLCKWLHGLGVVTHTHMVWCVACIQTFLQKNKTQMCSFLLDESQLK